MLHASTDDAHLQIPFPLLAAASQYSPVVIPEHDASDEVHLHSPSEASQKGACRLEHASNVAVHLHILFAGFIEKPNEST